jgi:hypothetical protein
MRTESTADPVESADTAVRNQLLFRFVNEKVRLLGESLELAADVEPTLDFRDWFCECGDVRCTERITLSAAEYADVRSDPALFAVVPSHAHVDAATEVVVARRPRYWVVEKVGRGRSLARDAAPTAA